VLGLRGSRGAPLRLPHLAAVCRPARHPDGRQGGFDEAALYIVILAPEARMERLRAQHTNRDEKELWKDDCVEVYVSPDHSMEACRKFVVNSIGTQTDMMGEHNIEWSSPLWTVATDRAQDGWSVELRVRGKFSAGDRERVTCGASA